jgi:hypothetical protein
VKGELIHQRKGIGVLRHGDLGRTPLVISNSLHSLAEVKFLRRPIFV